MSPEWNATHDPSLRSWVDSANLSDCDFPVQNLPLAIFRPKGGNEGGRIGVGIGDQILDLQVALSRDAFGGLADEIIKACREPTLNALMSLGQDVSSRLRASLSEALREGSAAASQLQGDLLPQSETELLLPAFVGDYTDFYSSIHHATTVGKQFRPDNPLLPNYKWLPVAYHGRSSSVQVSGRDFHRPVGQRLPQGAASPQVSATRRLDFELEVGVFIGRGNPLGRAVSITEAESHIFGLCLLNDWSARDIQGWEYQPLGPFLSKNFATTISPWVVSMEALAPFRLPFSRAPADPQPLSYLHDPTAQHSGAIDVVLEVSLETARMREAGLAPQRLALSNLRHAYWTLAQMVAHHTINGCNLRSGDLLGTGTLSGPSASEAGSLLELSAAGKTPIAVGVETRTFLEDGDRVLLRAWCEGSGRRRIGFGAAAATVLPARIL